MVKEGLSEEIFKLKFNKKEGKPHKGCMQRGQEVQDRSDLSGLESGPGITIWGTLVILMGR